MDATGGRATPGRRRWLDGSAVAYVPRQRTAGRCTWGTSRRRRGSFSRPSGRRRRSSYRCSRN
eukprot:8873015-Alexandrium_andersonii.AAC.1